ncbi:hypothetical protein CHH27_01200 [Labrenzia sp. VG12]|nr:hypothetical protein CHH27_01200 [Labrenzia sp. VG12]
MRGNRRQGRRRLRRPALGRRRLNLSATLALPGACWLLRRRGCAFVGRDQDGWLLLAAGNSDGHLRIGRQGGGNAQVDLAVGCRQPDDTTRQIAFHARLQLGPRLELGGSGTVGSPLRQRRRSHCFNHHTFSG